VIGDSLLGIRDSGFEIRSEQNQSILIDTLCKAPQSNALARTNLESRISSLESRISNLESRISNLESRVTVHELQASTPSRLDLCFQSTRLTADPDQEPSFVGAVR
jgi:hypothetical protein